MLKKLVLGLLTLSILASPTQYFSAAKPEINPDVQIQKKNATDLLCEGVSINGPVSGGVGGGGGYIPIGTTPISFNPDLLLENDPKVFTVTFDLNAMIHLFSEITYESNDGSLLLSRSIAYGVREYKVMAENTVGVHEFYADTYQGRTCLYRAFSYIYKNKVYISKESKEDAWREAVINDYANGNISEMEMENNYAEFLALISPNSNKRETGDLPPRYSQRPTNNDTAHFYSHVTWQDKSGEWIPLSLCEVSLIINDTLIEKKHLDENGYVFFDISSNSRFWGKTCKVQMHIFTRTNTFTFGKFDITNSGVSPVSNAESVGMISSEACETIIDGTINKGLKTSWAYTQYSETTSAMSICQALAFCERFANRYVNGFAGNPNLITNDLKVQASYGTCTFDFANSSKIFFEADQNWLLAFRLYGLYVQGITNMLGTNTLMSFNDDYGNFVYEKDMQVFSKEKASQVVWHRSLADMFTILAYLWTEDELNGITVTQPIRDLIDTIENYTPDETAGEGSILCVTTYLYNIYTGYTSKDGKPVDGKPSFFNYVFNSAFNTVNEFINYMYPTDPWTNSGNNSLLEDLCIAPSKIRIVNELNDYDLPIFEWKAGGCKSHPNDVFDLWIYNNHGSTIFNYRIEDIKNTSYAMDSQGMVKYTFNSEQKAQLMNIVNQCDNTCFMAVCGYRRDGNYSTGPYYSMFTRIAKTEIVGDEPMFGKKIELTDIRDNKESIYIKFRRPGNAVFISRGFYDSLITISDIYGRMLTSSQGFDTADATNGFVSYNVSTDEIYLVTVEIIENTIAWKNYIYLDVVPNANSYDSDYQINHPTSYNEIMSIDFSLDWLTQDMPSMDYRKPENKFYHKFDVEEGSNALLLYEAERAGGYHLELNYTDNISVAIIYLDSHNEWNYEYYSGSKYHAIGLEENFINLLPGQPIMLLISREDINSPLPIGSIPKSFELAFGLTYLEDQY